MALSKAGGKATATTVTLKHLAAALAEKHEIAKKQADAILTDLVALVTKHLKKGERIRIVGLGILQVRKRAARMGRNPATGEAIKIKASKKVAFRAVPTREWRKRAAHRFRCGAHRLGRRIREEAHRGAALHGRRNRVLESASLREVALEIELFEGGLRKAGCAKDAAHARLRAERERAGIVR